MSWVESHSLSFSARHDSADARDAAAVLDSLESFRDALARRFERMPEEVAVVLHPRPAALALAHPWLPLARLVSAPAGRRYFAGWFSETAIHVLSPRALERRASNVAGSREALLLAPRHEYAHLVIGANNPDLPPPFSPAAFRRYARWAWLCEGAAAWLSGQTPQLRAAIVRRLRESGRPEFPPPARDAMLLGGTIFAMLEPPPARDAMLLGGTIFAMLEREAGTAAATRLAVAPLDSGARSLLVDAFGRRIAQIERDWREELDSLSAA